MRWNGAPRLVLAPQGSPRGFSHSQDPQRKSAFGSRHHRLYAIGAVGRLVAGLLIDPRADVTARAARNCRPGGALLVDAALGISAIGEGKAAGDQGLGEIDASREPSATPSGKGLHFRWRAATYLLPSDAGDWRRWLHHRRRWGAFRRWLRLVLRRQLDPQLGQPVGQRFRRLLRWWLGWHGLLPDIPFRRLQC